MPKASQLGRSRSLGASARYANPREKKGGEWRDKNAGITRRFESLLALPFEDLPDELRRFLRLLRSVETRTGKGAPIDFGRLLYDLLNLSSDDPKRPEKVRLDWARDYWPSTLDTDDSTPETD